jgi:hypothetical protein
MCRVISVFNYGGVSYLCSSIVVVEAVQHPPPFSGKEAFLLSAISVTSMHHSSKVLHAALPLHLLLPLPCSFVISQCNCIPMNMHSCNSDFSTVVQF